jgi:hypothetical protein
MAEIREKFAYAPDGTSLQIYRYSTYDLSEHLISPFQWAAITRYEQFWDKGMSKVRILIDFMDRLVNTLGYEELD